MKQNVHAHTCTANLLLRAEVGGSKKCSEPEGLQRQQEGPEGGSRACRTGKVPHSLEGPRLKGFVLCQERRLKPRPPYGRHLLLLDPERQKQHDGKRQVFYKWLGPTCKQASTFSHAGEPKLLGDLAALLAARAPASPLRRRALGETH